MNVRTHSPNRQCPSFDKIKLNNVMSSDISWLSRPISLFALPLMVAHTRAFWLGVQLHEESALSNADDGKKSSLVSIACCIGKTVDSESTCIGAYSFSIWDYPSPLWSYILLLAPL